MRHSTLILVLSLLVSGCTNVPFFDDEPEQSSSTYDPRASTTYPSGVAPSGSITYQDPYFNAGNTAGYGYQPYNNGLNYSDPGQPYTEGGFGGTYSSYSSLPTADFWSLPLNSFEHWLFRGYLSMAKYEEREQDFPTMELFQQRAAQLPAGNLVDPFYPERRGVPQDKLQELVNGRQRLMNAYLRGVTVSDAKQAAEAQVFYDCWVHEQAENFQQGDIERCRTAFCSRVARLEGAICPKCGETCSMGGKGGCGLGGKDVCAIDPELMIVRRKAPLAPAEQAREPKRFIVYFDFDKSTLDAEAREVVRELIDYTRVEKPVNILLYGNTDTMGTKGYNQALGDRRAKRVEKALVDSGYSINQIHHLSYGETKLKVKTADQVKERMNRRTEIELLWEEAIPPELR